MTTRREAPPKQSNRRYWSAAVTEHSNAMDLEAGVFKLRSPKRIAESLKKSAEESLRRKGSPLQSAMSMLNFYMNRAGRNLTAAQDKRLTAAKGELRRLFGRSPSGARRTTSPRPRRRTRS